MLNVNMNNRNINVVYHIINKCYINKINITIIYDSIYDKRHDWADLPSNLVSNCTP